MGTTGNRLMNETGPKERTMVKVFLLFILRGKRKANTFFVALCCWCLGRLDRLGLLGWLQG